MIEFNDMPEDLLELADLYVSGSIDEDRLKALEERLRTDEQARGCFVRYCRMHTDLHLDMRARLAGERALRTIERTSGAPSAAAEKHHARAARGARWRWRTAGAAAVLLVAGLGLWFASDARKTEGGIAWLVNAQSCLWADDSAPAGDMPSGKVLRLRRGLAEIRFLQGARVILEGPAGIELLCGNSARVLGGKLTAKVPASAKGFQLLSPQGKVVDLGTEFGMAVADDGTTHVYVFAGQVEAHAAGAEAAPFVRVQEKQAARIDARGVSLKPDATADKDFVRDIPVNVPRVFALDFRCPSADTLLDASGRGTGLTHRLPGTGRRLKKNDANLVLNLQERQLELTTTDSDLNTQYNLGHGEYLGIRLSDLGFTGKEDFAVTVVVPNIPALKTVGQFGLYAATRSDWSIRGGMISRREPDQYRQFLVQNHDGIDAKPHYVGLGFPGDDLRMTLRREGATFLLTVENLTTVESTIVTMRQPQFLEGEPDIYVGFFGANTQSEVRRTLVLKEFKVTVWTLVQS